MDAELSMTTIKVKGMTCGGCAASVRRAIAEADPKATFDVDLKGQAVHVQGDRDVPVIRAAIVRAGYQVVD